MAQDMEITKTISDKVDANRGELIKALQGIVRIPTQTGQEGAGQKYMQKLYSDLGLKTTAFEVDREKIKKHRAYVEAGYDFKGRPDVVGIYPGSKKGKSLVINGHIDVVSPEPVADWKHPPYQADVVDNRLYGRGAWDMKGGLITNYFALKTLLDAGIKPLGSVTLQSVIEEEAGGNGTLACLLEGYTGDGLLITEPGTRIVLAHPGVHYFKVKVQGKSAHAGISHRGVNAIGKMNLLYDALIDLDLKRAKNVHYEIFEKDTGRSCNLNIGVYRAGDWASIVPGSAEMQCRIANTPRENFEDVKKEVERTIREAASHDEWLKEHPPEITWFGVSMDAWEQDPQAPFVKTFKACAEEALGKKLNIGGVTWGLDNRLATYFNMPAISFGPEGAGIHGVDEWVDLDSVIACTKAVALFITRWCGIA
jgi:acetylornithine deacetylase